MSNHSPDALKRCCCCKQTMPSTDFCRDRAKADGLQARCKNCHRLAVYATRARRGRVESEHAMAAQRRACARYYAAHMDERKGYLRKRRAYLTDGYVAESLGLRLADTPPELIRVQRARLRLTRELRKELR